MEVSLSVVFKLESKHACSSRRLVSSNEYGYSLFSFVPDISAAISAASDFINLLDTKPVIDAESEEGVIPKEVKGEITLEDVHFHYPTRPEAQVLRGLNMVAKPGSFVALVGASGCGKSTIIQLIERFYDSNSGKVLLDGQEIQSFNLREYRKHIALVSQEPVRVHKVELVPWLMHFIDFVCWDDSVQYSSWGD